MGKPISQLEVEIFDWPDRFFVESEGPDRDYYHFWPGTVIETYPHFIDLDIYETGWCSCRDFRFGVEPFLHLEVNHRRECIHIIAAKRYKNLLVTKPKPMPTKLFT